MAGNPFTVATATELSLDPEYDPYANAPFYVRWAIAYSKLHWGWKLGIGILLLVLAGLFTFFGGGGWLGIADMLYELTKGILLGIGFWILGCAFTGTPLTWKGLANAALDAFLVTSAILFVSSLVNVIRVAYRSKLLAKSTFPPNNGAVPGTEEKIILEPGVYGRYGEIGTKSRYITNNGASPEQLSLPPWNDGVYTEIQVIKPIKSVQKSIVAPWEPWGGIGGGEQYYLPKTITKLIKGGYIRLG